MLTSLGEVTTQIEATARKPGDGPTGGAGTAGLRLCLKWLWPAKAGQDVTWSQSSYQGVHELLHEEKRRMPRGPGWFHGAFHFARVPARDMSARR
jgi:hypothetical protein